MDSSSRRSSPRCDVVLKVDYLSRRDLLADYATNLGEGGLFVRTPVPFEVGTQLELQLSFPGVVRPFPVRAVVRWVAGADQREPGVGVEFLRDVDHPKERIERILRLSLSPPRPTRRSFRMLLVEDNSLVRELFAHAVRRFHAKVSGPHGLEVIPVSTGLEVEPLLAEGEFHCAIVDQYLPGRSGIEVIRLLRGHPRHHAIPILAVSVGGNGVREQALAAGADVYLDKPVLATQLISTLGRLLDADAPDTQPALGRV